MPTAELLAPARDLDCGIAAIDSGADAVYIGAPQFGARSRAGNSLEDIAALARYAHTYWARVYVTVNTLLFDGELPQAVRLIHQLYDMGVDAAIIQDVGLLECDLPPIALIASTQMHNHTPERVAFLERIGFQRVILAREMSLEQIRAIRTRTSLELETFIHGALCVSYSGQCTLSYAIGGRSGNRGECAQPCRRRYTLVAAPDMPGNCASAPIIEKGYLLSLRDLNLTDHLDELLDAGVTCFKIEGRLKDRAYVTNVVSWYRQHLDHALTRRGWSRTSSGASRIDFEPDVAKTFNRGFTSHFLHGRRDSPGAIESPKMVGEPLGTVTAVEGRCFLLDTSTQLHSGDGLCWFDERHKLRGTVVNAIQEGSGVVRVTPQRTTGIRPGLAVFRNHDHAFLRLIQHSRPSRKIAVRLSLSCTETGFVLRAEDEDGNTATGALETEKEVARNPHRAEATARRQLEKTGESPFSCARIDLDWDEPFFLPVSEINALRRDTLDRLSAVRNASRSVMQGQIQRNDAAYPERTLDYRGNALNQKAVEFYRRHGVEEIAPAAESGLDMAGRVVMRTRYCIRHQLGLCDGAASTGKQREALTLVDEDGHCYPLHFDCAACEMEVIY